MEKITLRMFFALLSSKIKSCLLPRNKIASLGLQTANLFLSPQSQNAALRKGDRHYRVSKLGIERFFLSFKNVVTVLLICFLGFSSQIYGQFANVTTPSGGFAIDGGLRANAPTSPAPFAPNQGDWYPTVNDLGTSVFNNSGNVISPATSQTSGRSSGENFNSNDNIFTNGSKFNDYISDLRWFTNSAPDKNDINNALYHVARDAGNNQWIFISGDRLSTNGTSYIDFELLQGTVVQNSDGTFTGIPLASKLNGGGRTLDDIIISMEYTNGGSKPNVYIYQWMKSGTKWSYQLVTLADLGANAFAETNRTGAESNVPYSAFGTNTYQQFAFVEAAVNVTYLLNQALGGSICSSLKIKTLWVKTKASASSTAALKDYIEPIPVNFTFGSTDITGIGPFCANSTERVALSATPPGGVFSGDGVTVDGSTYYFTPSRAAASTGTNPFLITYNYSSSNGSCSGTFDVIVVANPVALVLTGSSICASNSGTGTVSSSTSQSGVSYQLRLGTTNVQGPKEGTGSALSWTALAAGSSYNVVSTGATPTNCPGSSNSVNVTEVANPVTLVLTGSSICASNSGTGTVSSSTSQSGVSYQLRLGTTNVQDPKVGTGNALLWTALATGSSYNVVSTGATPTNCPGSSNSVNVTEVANPVTLVLTGSSICASNSGTGTVSSSTSQSGVSYQLRLGATNVQDPKVGTGNALIWTALNAGTNYNVVSTGLAPTNCPGSSNGVNITEDAVPSIPTVVYNAPRCDENTFSITVTGVINGAIYTVKDKNGNTIGGLSPASPKTASSTADITFSNIPAGSGYQVSVSDKGCVSLPNTCGVATTKQITTKTEEVLTPAAAKNTSNGFDAYPVPFKDQLTIKYKFDYKSDVKIEVFNSRGISVLSKTDTGSYLNKEITLDLHGNKEKEQVYIVKLTTDRETITKKVLSSK